MIQKIIQKLNTVYSALKTKYTWIISTVVNCLPIKIQLVIKKIFAYFWLVMLVIFVVILVILHYRRVEESTEIYPVTHFLPFVSIDNQGKEDLFWREEVVQVGDNLSRILTRFGLPERQIQNMIRSVEISDKLLQLKPEQVLSIQMNQRGDLAQIQFFNDDDNGDRNMISMIHRDGKWSLTTEPLETETLPTLKAVVIHTSAYGALAQAGVPVDIRESLREIFKGKVDFQQLHHGDVIRVIYNSLYFRGQELGTADILAAEITHNGKTDQAFYFEDDDGHGQYYDAHGKPLNKGFSIQPVAGARVSSPFGTRYHPILHVIKMHTGIDFAAPTGTPIRVPADGVVEQLGYKKGYGNTIVLRHSANMQTWYAHMSRYGQYRVGSRVKVGDILGYVGSTGRSTGPHLHYEVRINGQPVNPATVALPVKQLSKNQIVTFKKYYQQFNQDFDRIRPLLVMVAQLD